jgi:FkbH-like protein
MYAEEKVRKQMETSSSSMEHYLINLGLEAQIGVPAPSDIARCSQLTQKTNQFNLTTYRYTDSEILSLQNDGAKIFTLSVKDKFGDSGLTGVCLVKFDGQVAEIDTLLMSCRILGKGIESVFVKYVLQKLVLLQFAIVKSKYIGTLKNKQVEDFYDKCGFKCSKWDESTNTKEYIIHLKDCVLEFSDNYKIVEL